MRVFLCPNPHAINKYNGIGRVLHAQFQYLPEYGIEFVNSEDQADVVACHTQQFDCNRIDVLHLHGIYWTGDPNSGIYNKWHNRANTDIVNATRRALEVTVPSDWVGEFLRRDFKVQPVVIPHGINIDEWQPSVQHENYVFWAKNRPGDVCNPEPMYQLVERLPEVRFVSTFAPTGKPVLNNLTVCGALDPGNMNTYLHLARIYLATTHETWGITTIEAMACGVPTLGYRWGGTAELVKQGVTGWLAEPGDIEGLAQGYQYLIDNWDECSAACIEEAKNWTWARPMKMYADLYQKAFNTRAQETHKVSIVVTNYNYAPYLKDSVGSALEQKLPAEVIVVDDGSTDNSLEVLAEFGDKIKVVIQHNQGVAVARNNGIAASTGDYIVCLDADDMLHPEYTEVLVPAFKEDRGLGVAYTGMELKSGDDYRFNSWPPEFKWDIMTTVSNPPSNCIHCAAMFRRSMWWKAGGYRQMYAPAEDTEFWVRGLAFGYTARMITTAGLFIYRVHANSASRTKVYNRIDYWHPWMRDKKYPLGAPSAYIPLIRSYSKPIFSIVFEKKSNRSAFLESVLGQTFRNWEVLEIGKNNPHDSYPFLKFVEPNKIAEKSRGQAVLIVKANILSPETLQTILDDLRNGTYKDTIDYELYEIQLKEGKRTMPCSTCGGQISPDFLERLRAINQMDLNSAGTQEFMLQATDAGSVRMRFTGESFGAATYGGPGVTPSGTSYRGGANPFDKFINADPRDVDWLRNSGFWEVQPPPPPEPVQVSSLPTAEVSANIKALEKLEELNKIEVVVEPVDVSDSFPEPEPMPEVKVEYKYKKERAHMKKAN